MNVTCLATDNWKLSEKPQFLKVFKGWMGCFEIDVPNPGEIKTQGDWTRVVFDMTTTEGKSYKLTGRIQWETAEATKESK